MCTSQGNLISLCMYWRRSVNVVMPDLRGSIRCTVKLLQNKLQSFTLISGIYHYQNTYL